MSIKLLDDFVYLREEDHRYFDRKGNEYLSQSAFISSYGKKIDSQQVSYYVSKAKGVPQQDILDEWDAKTEWGTRVHDAVELYDNTTTIKPENEHLRPLISSISKEYAGYYRSYSEQVLYDPENMIAGKTDRLLQRTNSSKSIIDITDFKNYGKIEYTNSANRYMLEPITHLPDCNFIKAVLQLSLYAYMYNKKTGGRIGLLSIHHIPPEDPLNHYKIPVPYMKLEIEAILHHKKYTTIIK